MGEVDSRDVGVVHGLVALSQLEVVVFARGTGLAETAIEERSLGRARLGGDR